MHESDSLDIVFDGAEAELIRDALQGHEPKAPDTEQETVDDLEARFDSDLDDDEEAEFELTRAEARIVLSAIEAREATAGTEREMKLEGVRDRIDSAFEFDERSSEGAEPLDDEQYPGST